jgi:hypothetical protein
VGLLHPLNHAGNLAIAALEPDTQSSFFTNRLVNNLAGIARVMSNLVKVRGVALTSRRFEVLSARLYPVDAMDAGNFPLRDLLN